jgi:hypothetical protein
MANDTKSNQSDKNEPQPIGKAIRVLLPIYVLIGGFAIWQVRKTCLLQRDDCDYYGLLESVLSDRLLLIGSVIILGVLLQITWHIVGLARAGKLGIQQDPPERKFNVSGLMVALVVFLVYLGGSLVILISTTNDLGQFDAGNPNIFVWTIMGPQYGCAFVFMVLWHLNEYFVKPVSNIVLLLLFLATFGSIYLFIKSIIWT